MPQSEWPTAADQRDSILRDFDHAGNVGDRRQEIVFIGMGMDETAIVSQLDAALLSDEEMVRIASRCMSCRPQLHCSSWSSLLHSTRNSMTIELCLCKHDDGQNRLQLSVHR